MRGSVLSVLSFCQFVVTKICNSSCILRGVTMAFHCDDWGYNSFPSLLTIASAQNIQSGPEVSIPPIIKSYNTML